MQQSAQQNEWLRMLEKRWRHMWEMSRWLLVYTQVTSKL
jgi:hypothetical protein